MSLSFLFCKPWHPATVWNQRKIWEAEQKHAKRKKDEETANKDLARESDRRRYEQMAGDKGEPDPSSSTLNFMYAPPPGFQQGSDYNNMIEQIEIKLRVGLQHSAEAQDEELNGDDEAVKKFKAMTKMKTDPNFSASAHCSELEKLVGRRVNPGVSLAEQQERFSFLKNAPVEHEYASGVKVNFKPFNKVVRHVKCMRCGEWGHRSGDRECKLANENPNDVERRLREDPLSYMKPGGDSGGGGGSGGGSASGTAGRAAEDEHDDDPDSAFLKSLSSKDKKRLLRQLQEMEATEQGGDGGEDEGERKKGRKRKKDRKEKGKERRKTKRVPKEAKRKRDPSPARKVSLPNASTSDPEPTTNKQGSEDESGRRGRDSKSKKRRSEHDGVQEAEQGYDHRNRKHRRTQSRDRTQDTRWRAAGKRGRR